MGAGNDLREDALLANGSSAALDVLQQQLDEERVCSRQQEVTIAALRKQLGHAEAAIVSAPQQSEQYFDAVAEYRKPAQGDVLYTVVGATYGRPAFVDTDREFCVQRHIAILKPASGIDVKFLCFLLTSPLVYEQATRSTTGTAQPTIPLRPLRNFLVPLPPFPEQHRIVAKVEQLMSLCDRLEVQLTTTQTQSRLLLESVLHEALASA